MKKALLLFLFTLLASPMLGQTCTTATCTAAGVSEAQVLAAMPAPSNTNATVVINIPAGSSAWTSAFNYTFPAAVTNWTISGATVVSCTGTPGQAGYACPATDNTIISDNFSGQNQLISITAAGVNTFGRITGLTIQGGTGNSKNNGMFVVNGPTNNLRIDHNHFNSSTYTGGFSTFSAEVWGQVEGVADHNLMDTGGSSVTSNSIGVFNTLNDSIGFGDGTWANPTDFGGSDFFFIEDNVFNGGEAQDCADAGKFVLRYNNINNSSYGSAPIHAHGTKTQGGRGRGCRAYEAYNNYAVGPTSSGNADALVGSAGGTSLVYNNTIASGYNWFWAGSTTRNDGSATETNTPYGWGYCGTTVQSNGTGSAWDGNTNAGTGYPCMDGLGRGQGTEAMNGVNWPGALNSTTSSIHWLYEYLEPIYLIHNTLGGASQARINTGDTADQFNQDVYAYNASFTGASGTGYGLQSALPGTCTPGPGGTYGASPTGSYGVAYYESDTGYIDICTATNTWGKRFNPTYTYPHPLDGGVTTYTLTITTSGTGSGGVTGTNAALGSFAFASGTTIGPITPSPTGGSAFANWSGVTGSAACSGSTTPCPSFSITANTTINLVFNGGTPVCGKPTQNGPNYSATYYVPPTVLPLAIGFTNPTPVACPTMVMTLDGSAPSATCTIGGSTQAYAAQNITATTTLRVNTCGSGYASYSPIQGGTWTITTSGPPPQLYVISIGP